MVKFTKTDRVAIDAFAHIGADIAASPDDEDARRLRLFTASALRTQLGLDPLFQTLPPATTRLPHVAPESARAALLDDLKALDAPESASEPPDEALANAHLVVRRDFHTMLHSGALIDGLTGLAPGERLGPFVIPGGIDVWFDVFFAARRMEVRVGVTGLPDLVFTKARRPKVRGANITIDIEPGTVWIRGDLVDAALPAPAYVGIKVTGGLLKLRQQATINDNIIETTAALKGTLELKLAEDGVTTVAGACSTADAKLLLPDLLTVKFKSGTATIQGAGGKAQVWRQQFEFGATNGDRTFVPQLWTLVLGYDVDPQHFDTDPVGDDLVHFGGDAAITGAGLGLPVIAVSDAAILGEAAEAASWVLQVEKLTARWYDPDPRAHEMAQAWIAISAFGGTIVADAVAPLVPAVTHSYSLWEIAETKGQRLPWRQTYAEGFALLYRCHVVEGEHFVVHGQADVTLDRPVTTNGAPVPTPAKLGVLLLHRFKGVTTAHLAASFDTNAAAHQLALRNALVWTGTPLILFVRGELPAGGSTEMDRGTAQLLLGVYDWAPTLPDPYVANAGIRRRKTRARRPQSVMVARVAWSAPDQVVLTFEGQLGPGLALEGREVSSAKPQPVRNREGSPDVGLTQVEQGSVKVDGQSESARRRAREAEQKGRGQRVKAARSADQKITSFFDRSMPGAGGVALLDVSTNQDLLGVTFSVRGQRDKTHGLALSTDSFSVSDMAVHSQVAGMRVIMLPQVQWEPVRTLDADQDIMTMGWFPTPLAAANDGGATQIGANYQKLMPIIPEDVLQGTFEAYEVGKPVGIRTTFPFGLVGVIGLEPVDTASRKADLYGQTRPKFSDEHALGGIQVTARAEGGRPDQGGVSPMFKGQLRQLLNGVDLASGAPLGISVLGSTGDPAGSVETVFNNDMAARPRVPVTRLDLSGYGGSSFSDWNNPFAAFAEAAKVQFRYMIGRTALEVIKVNTVWHPWGVRMTRSVTIERRSGGGVIRRDSGWQPFTPGIFDYRYADAAGDIVVAPYQFDAGMFRGLFNVRNIRPAPGTVFSHGTAQLVPYYADADIALEGLSGRTKGIGILGYLQTAPNGLPVDEAALQALIETQGPIGGPLDAWIEFGGSGLPFRAQRIEVGLAKNGPAPLFVATVRGAPKLPKTGSWSVVRRPVAAVPANGGEASPIAENRGVPLIRRYPVRYDAGDDTSYPAPRLDPGAGPLGDYRFADAADLLVPATPANDYALLQSTPTHAFLFPRPFVPSATGLRLESGEKPALADIFARSTSKGSFPPPENTIELTVGAHHFDVGPKGELTLSPSVSIVGHPTPLRIAGSTGHGSALLYDDATITLELEEERWAAEFLGLRIWSDISGLERISGSELHIVGSTEQRPQIAEIKTLVLQEIEEILQYIPLFGARGTQGPIDLGASNAKHEFKVAIGLTLSVPPPAVVATFPAGSGVVLTLSVKQKTGLDIATGGPKASAIFGAVLDGKIPLLSVGVATVFLIITGKVTFSLTSVSGAVTSEKLELMAFVGIGIEGKIGPFKAYAFLGIGFILVYDAIADQTKYGGLVALEAGVNLQIVTVKIRAELKGLIYENAGQTMCDYSGSVKIQVNIFLVFSISASYQITETTTF